MSHRRGGREAGTEVTLPITPMLDMSFQLLFFFMATFNPTDPEGAQALAMAREKKAAPKTDDIATNPKNVRPDVAPGKKPKPMEEEPEIDTDLRLIIDTAGGKEPILLKNGAVDLRKADDFKNPKLLEDLRASMQGRVSTAITKVKQDLSNAGKAESCAGLQANLRGRPRQGAFQAEGAHPDDQRRPVGPGLPGHEHVRR